MSTNFQATQTQESSQKWFEEIGVQPPKKFKLGYACEGWLE